MSPQFVKYAAGLVGTEGENELLLKWALKAVFLKKGIKMKDVNYNMIDENLADICKSFRELQNRINRKLRDVV